MTRSRVRFSSAPLRIPSRSRCAAACVFLGLGFSGGLGGDWRDGRGWEGGCGLACGRTGGAVHRLRGEVAVGVEARGLQHDGDVRGAGPVEEFVEGHGAVDAAEFAEVALEFDQPEDAAEVDGVEVDEMGWGDGVGDGAVVVAVAHGAEVFLRGGDELQVRIDVGLGAGALLGQVGRIGAGVDGLHGARECVGGGDAGDGCECDECGLRRKHVSAPCGAVELLERCAVRPSINEAKSQFARAQSGRAVVRLRRKWLARREKKKLENDGARGADVAGARARRWMSLFVRARSVSREDVAGGWA